MTERDLTGLTDAHADGLACVVCERDYLRAPGSVSLLVDRLPE